MESLKVSLKRLSTLCVSRNFDADQRVAVQMFTAAVDVSTSTAAIAVQYEIVRRVLNRRLTILKDLERSAVRDVFKAWNTAVAADLRLNAPLPVGYDPIHLGA